MKWQTESALFFRKCKSHPYCACKSSKQLKPKNLKELPKSMMNLTRFTRRSSGFTWVTPRRRGFQSVDKGKQSLPSSSTKQAVWRLLLLPKRTKQKKPSKLSDKTLNKTGQESPNCQPSLLVTRPHTQTFWLICETTNKTEKIWGWPSRARPTLHYRKWSATSKPCKQLSTTKTRQF